MSKAWLADELKVRMTIDELSNYPNFIADPSVILARQPNDDTRLDMVLAQNKLDMDKVYNERNRLVALLAHLFPSGVAPDVTTPDWLIIYIDLPTGQASWHVPVAEKDLFAGIPEYTKPWDGHTMAEKYRRIEKLASILTGFNVSIAPQEI